MHGFFVGWPVMYESSVAIGQLWSRRNGVIYQVSAERDRDGLREVLLVPVSVPEGLSVRRTWKWDAAVEAEFERYGE